MFSQGVSYLFKGFKLIRQPGLRRFVVIPLLINIILFTGILWGGEAWLDHLIESMIPDGWDWLRWIIWPIVALLAIAFIFYTFTLLANLIGSPFNGLLSEKVEQRLRCNPNAPSTTLSLAYVLEAIRGELSKWLYYLGWIILLLILGFIPLINFLSPLFWSIFGAWMMAVEYSDFPLGNRLIPPKNQRQWLRENRPLALGFGAATLFGTMIPIINLAVMPAAVAGATALILDHYQTTENTQEP